MMPSADLRREVNYYRSNKTTGLEPRLLLHFQRSRKPKSPLSRHYGKLHRVAM